MPTGCKASVPGDVTDDLHKAGVIEDPLYAENLKTCSWIYEEDWTYECTFDAETDLFEKSCVRLVFEGVDTLSEIRLNGVLLGKTENMFLRYEYDVKPFLKAKDNRLTVKIFSSRKYIREKNDGKDRRALFNKDRLFLRKAQCQFGWDWAPCLPGIGLWLPCYLIADDGARINDVRVTTKNDGCVRVEVNAQIPDSGYALRVTVGEQTKRIAAAPFSACDLFVENAKLWWPNGYGEQNLYDYIVVLEKDGEALDEKRGKTAFRTVELYQEPLGGEEYNFGFKVNGRKIFAKGSNWVPCSNMTGAIPEAMYERLLRIAREANMNMLRVWGGGIYEKEIFYELCDKLGILVWQDFAFACSAIPADVEGIEENFLKEAAYQIKRLRNHPSLVLWCGGNEFIPHLNGVPYERGNALIKSVLPDLLKNSDDRPYIYNSPMSLEGDDWLFMSGDNHTSCLNAAIVDDKLCEYRRYIAQKPSHFISESAILGSTRIRSLKKFIPEDRLWQTNECWEYHFVENPHNVTLQKPFTWQEKKMAEDLFGDISTLPLFAKKSMLAMAEIMRSEADFTRANKNCAGYMNWMYNDTWGCGTWALVDYYYEKKPALYFLKRSFSDFCVCFTETKEGLRVSVINETKVRREGVLRVSCKRLNGETLTSCDFCAAVEQDGIFETYLEKYADGDYLLAEWCGADGEKRKEIYFHNLWKEKAFVSDIESVTEQIDEYACKITIKARQFARAVFIDYPDNADICYEDNFFDMEKGDERTVTIVGRAPIESAAFTVKTYADEWND